MFVSEDFEIFDIPIIWLWTYLLKVVSEKRRAH